MLSLHMPADFIKELVFAGNFDVQKDVFRPKVFGDGTQWILHGG